MTNKGFSLQDALFIGFCATLLVALKGMLRLKLGLTGHSMFLMSFFYLICYGAVGKKGAITVCGLLAGLIAMMLSVGKGGPFILVKFALPAVAMDLCLFVLPTVLALKWRCIILAVVATFAWASKGFIEDLLVGLSIQVALFQLGKSVLFGSGFAILGALLVPPVLGRLRSHDLIDNKER
ncbi:core component of ECF transporter [Shewanella sp. Isolate11]|uniref:core component of ECF transporter n=1 Tax=Shewanella sp. Isolate11 TaxID=2908530 RepID=UPI001EFD8367|nr:core component of ECF transporter [Shewanella sp. Isolate11]MCG9697951.1 core component of ECF transporter [Shewanella sp. Isolate11]